MFTRNHPGKLHPPREAGGVVRAARAGAGREIWVSEALLELQRQPGGERFGVWLDASPEEESAPGSRVIFRGKVRHRGEGNEPGNWTNLSVELPLPLDLLSIGKTAELTLPENLRDPFLGPTLGMRHVLWVPVFGQNLLRGLILVAAQDSGRPLPRTLAEQVAAELALALESEEQNRLARERKADLELTFRVHSLLAQNADADQILLEISESCTGVGGPQGVGAIFALIGQRKSGLAVAAPSGAGAEERLWICALSGDPAWGHSVEQGPLEMFWRRAIETGEVAGADAGALPLARNIARIVAIPLNSDGTTHGVLLAGLPRGRTSLESLERLERRALLSTQVFEQQERLSERARAEKWRLAMLESSEQPLVLLDRGGFLRGMSQGARKILSPDSSLLALRWEKPELRFVELFRPREWERVSGWLQSGAAGGKLSPAASVPLIVQSKNGTDIQCRRSDLTASGFLAVAIARAVAGPGERRKEDVEAELRQTVGWMSEGVAVFDETGGIRAANEQFYRLLGLAHEESAGLRTLEELLALVAPHAADPEEFSRRWRALADLQEDEFQEDLAMKWPVPQTIERCSRTIAGEGGRRLGRVEVYRETAARRSFQSRMVQTEKLVSLGQRVSGIVHELSNPLTTILGYAQRLLQREAGHTGAATRELRGLLAEAERATGILRQVLQLSGDAGGVREPVSLNELVDRTVGLMRATLSGSPIRLMVEKGASPPGVEGDFGQLQQVLLNLLQNAQQAIIHSGQGGLIGVRTASAGNGRARLEVWDDGPGVPGAIQARIFDPFFTTKPPGVGTGLGLAIVLGFVRQHGGTVNLISPPKGGTRFVVELPAAPAAREKPVPVTTVLRLAEQLPVRETSAPGEHRPPRVLVVEDEPTVGGLIADVLRDEGMRVDVLRDGESALDRAEREEYDLVICDLKMPGMDGQKFFQSLGKRRNPLQGHVLFVTGDVVAPRTQEFLERHRLPYVAKPFRVEELSRAVRGML
ncbi:MAG TPA: ATP-binding protein [Candidatus Acidoferrum sp.]|nr:ATP-binding protein [Candidatus Acidoferrum sp.]